MADTVTRKYRVSKCSVCNHEFAEQADTLDCPTCGMHYDLIKRKSDKSSVLISPLDCTHQWDMQSGSDDFDGNRHTVSVCLYCGEIRVFGTSKRENGHFDIQFTIGTDKALEAVGKWLQLLYRDDERKAKTTE